MNKATLFFQIFLLSKWYDKENDQLHHFERYFKNTLDENLVQNKRSFFLFFFLGESLKKLVVEWPCCVPHYFFGFPKMCLLLVYNGSPSLIYIVASSFAYKLSPTKSIFHFHTSLTENISLQDLYIYSFQQKEKRRFIYLCHNPL